MPPAPSMPGPPLTTAWAQLSTNLAEQDSRAVQRSAVQCRVAPCSEAQCSILQLLHAVQHGAQCMLCENSWTLLLTVQKKIWGFLDFYSLEWVPALVLRHLSECFSYLSFLNILVFFTQSKDFKWLKYSNIYIIISLIQTIQKYSLNHSYGH